MHCTFLKSYIVQYLFCLKDLAAKLQSQLDEARMLKDSRAQAKARKTDEVRKTDEGRGYA